MLTVVENRFQQQSTLYSLMKSEKLAVFFILGFILLIASFNVIGSLSMLIIEKKKDIKILGSMGADERLIRRIFLVEGLLVTTLGALTGLILGAGICWVQQRFGLVKLQVSGGSFLIDSYPVSMQLFDFVMVFLTVFFFGVLFGLVSLTLLVPILQILFKQTALVTIAPTPITWDHITNTTLLNDNFKYFISQYIVEYGAPHTLLIICVVLVVLFFLKNFFRYMAMFYLAPVRNGVVKDIRNILYKKMLNLPLGYYSDQRKGDLMARLTTDVQEVEWSVMSSLEMMFREPFQILFYLATMLVMSPQLTLFVMIMLPITGLIIGQIGKSLKRTSVKGQRKMGEIL